MQNFMKTILSAVQTWTKGKIKESTADWSQNDSTADNYVKNRTHYDSRRTDTITYTFDGNVEDKEAVTVNDELHFVKLSDNSPLSNEIIGGTLCVYQEGTVSKITITEDSISVFSGSLYFANEAIAIAFADTEFDGITFTKGIWVLDIIVEGAPVVYVSELSYDVSVGELRKLDSKYLDLPTNLATTDNVQEAIDIANNAQTVADTAIENAATAQTTADSKMNIDNPVGTGSFSMNRKSGTTIGYCSVAEGYDTVAATAYSHAEGYCTQVLSENSTEVPLKWNSSYPDSGEYGHAEGFGSVSRGSFAHAEGHATLASDSAAHAEGTYTTASGYSSHAEGASTTASGYSSHTEGGSTIASGAYSHAEGRNTIASGDYSHAEGSNTIASRAYQSVQGTFNEFETSENNYIEKVSASTKNSTKTSSTSVYASTSYTFNADTGLFSLVNPQYVKVTSLPSYTYFIFSNDYTDISSINKYHSISGSSTTKKIYYYTISSDSLAEFKGNYAYIVGNGTADDARSNAHTLDWEGNAWYQGDVYVGSNSGINKDSGSKKLATEDFVREFMQSDEFKTLIRTEAEAIILGGAW